MDCDVKALRTYHGDEEDFEATLAKLFLQFRISIGRGRLGQDLNCFLEVGNFAFFTGVFKHSPSFIFGFGGNVINIEEPRVLALVSIVPLNSEISTRR